MSQSAAAKKYAQAYLRVYDSDLNRKDIESIQTLASFLLKHTYVVSLICTIMASEREQIAMSQKLMNHFAIHQTIQKLLLVLARRNDLCLLADVLQNICCLYKEQHKIIDLRIISAHVLHDHEIAKFTDFFEKQTGAQALVTTSVDRSLIAGVRLQSDRFLWDFSVAKRLRSLQHALFGKG